jgi:hypothetical protein
LLAGQFESTHLQHYERMSQLRPRRESGHERHVPGLFRQDPDLAPFVAVRGKVRMCLRAAHPYFPDPGAGSPRPRLGFHGAAVSCDVATALTDRRHPRILVSSHPN